VRYLLLLSLIMYTPLECNTFKKLKSLPTWISKNSPTIAGVVFCFVGGVAYGVKTMHYQTYDDLDTSNRKSPYSPEKRNEPLFDIPLIDQLSNVAPQSILDDTFQESPRMLPEVFNTREHDLRNKLRLLHWAKYSAIPGRRKSAYDFTLEKIYIDLKKHYKLGESDE
jgi:hypothetical protein